MEYLPTLVGGFKYFLFSPLFKEDSHFDYYVSKGLYSLSILELVSPADLCPLYGILAYISLMFMS